MTATLIPFPPRLVDLQPFSERECLDFLSPDRHDLLPVTTTAGESVSPPALSSATYSPWRTRREVYWS